MDLVEVETVAEYQWIRDSLTPLATVAQDRGFLAVKWKIRGCRGRDPLPMGWR
ncbi:MAG: hypothetical protein KAJ97_07865 [Acidobacteria bacterium]|nr:hypothetical protein [Acidobacteriota bacterium]